MADWSKLLKSLGFSDSESAVYLAALKLGPSAVQEIAKKAGVSRVTTYDVIESMTAQGLMSSVTKGKKQYYTAESPERLTSFVAARVEEMQGTLRELKSNVDELKMMQSGDKPSVKFYEGIEGIKAMQEDILGSNLEFIYEIGNRDQIIKTLPKEFLKKYQKALDSKNVKTKAIYVSNQPFVKRRKSTLKILDGVNLGLEGDISVYGDRLVLSTFKGKIIGVSIQSEDLAKTFKNIFEQLWKCLP